MEDSDQRSVCHPLPDGVESDRWAVMSAVRAYYLAELIGILRTYRSISVNFAPVDPGYYPA